MFSRNTLNGKILDALVLDNLSKIIINIALELIFNAGGLHHKLVCRRVFNSHNKKYK